MVTNIYADEGCQHKDALLQLGFFRTDTHFLSLNLTDAQLETIQEVGRKFPGVTCEEILDLALRTALQAPPLRYKAYGTWEEAYEWCRKVKVPILASVSGTKAEIWPNGAFVCHEREG